MSALSHARLWLVATIANQDGIHETVWGNAVGRSGAKKLDKQANKMAAKGYRLVDFTGPDSAGWIVAPFEKA